MRLIAQLRYIYNSIWYIMVLCLPGILYLDNIISAINVFSNSLIRSFSDNP